MKNIALIFFLATYASLAAQSSPIDSSTVLNTILASDYCTQHNRISYVISAKATMGSQVNDLVYVRDGDKELTILKVKDRINVDLVTPEQSYIMRPNVGEYNPQPYDRKNYSICSVNPAELKMYFKDAGELSWTERPTVTIIYKNSGGDYIKEVFDQRNYKHLGRTINYANRSIFISYDLEERYIGEYRFVTRQKWHKTERGRWIELDYQVDDIIMNPEGVEDLFDVKQYYGINTPPKQYNGLGHYFMDRVLGLPEDFQRLVLQEISAADFSSGSSSSSQGCGKLIYTSDDYECGEEIEVSRIECANARNVSIYQWGPGMEKNCTLSMGSSDVTKTGYYLKRSLEYDKFLSADFNEAVRLGCGCN